MTTTLKTNIPRIVALDVYSRNGTHLARVSPETAALRSHQRERPPGCVYRPVYRAEI